VNAHFRSVIILAVLLMLTVFSQAALCQNHADSYAGKSLENKSQSSLPELPQQEFQFPTIKVIGGMGLVLCLMGTVYFGAKKIFPQYFSKPKSMKNLRIVETLALGDRRSIALIEVGESKFLIGNTPQQINLVATLPESFSLAEPESLTAPLKSYSPKEAATPFRNLFEVEKTRIQKNDNILSDDLRSKMRQLREALERP
jgi:flagellar biosynthetic protein FliO